MNQSLSIQIERLRAKYPWRSYQSIAAQLGKGGAEAKAAKQRKKNERAREQRSKLYVTSWATKYDNY